MLHQRAVLAWIVQAVLLLMRSSLTDGSGHSQGDAPDVSVPFDPASPSSLVLLQLLFRHGDRSPTHMFSWDEHRSDWPQGRGQLTKLGMEQAYEYGSELRRRYADFLPADYSRFEVEVQSTDYDRTLMTAQCLLIGLFPTNISHWSPWQPIPIHTQDGENDHLFAHAPCPKLEQLLSQYYYSERSERFDAKYKHLYEQLSNHTRTIVNQTLAHEISDTIFCESQHNMSRPPWMTPKMFEELMVLKVESYSMKWRATGSAQLAGGPLLSKMTSNMEYRAQKSSSKGKLFLFSAHDDTVAGLSRVMGFFNDLQPPYLTSVILELHQQGHAFFVRTLYDNHTRHSPFIQTIAGCSQMCPLGEFRHLLEAGMLKAEDREKACALTTASRLWKENGVAILTGAVVVLVVAVTVMAYKLKKTRLQRRERGSIQYRKLLQDNADTEDDDSHPDGL
ncbi:prostatic acid phosphatase-like isoform X2 [Babylonia areolata]|uniref:prostatic acid phosphatase-like isoform X2 n=1 Tax=Babylonia areolata TaxID=304850 RepID=UPI003FCFA7B9